jgi:hypothetical protein
MTWTHNGTISFRTTAASGNNITTAGKELGAVTFTSGSSASVWDLQDDLTVSTTHFGSGQLTLAAGTLNTNNHNITCNDFRNAGTDTLNAGSSTITLTGTGTVWDTSTGALTFNAGTSTIVIANANGARTFIGGGKTYNNLTIKGHSSSDGARYVNITGSNVFNTLTLEQYCFCYPEYSQTQTIASLIAVASITDGISIATSSGPSGSATLSDPSGTNTVVRCRLEKVIGDGGATWNALDCTDAGGNTGWNFTSGSVIKTINGLAKASVKTINELATASVNTKNGLI